MKLFNKTSSTFKHKTYITTAQTLNQTNSDLLFNAKQKNNK